MTGVVDHLPAGPPGHIFVGNGRDYDRDRIGFLLRNQRRYGDVYSFSDTAIVVLDPQLIHQLHTRTNAEFVTEASLFSDRKRTEWLMGTITDTMSNRRAGWRGVSKTASASRAPMLVSAFDTVMRDVPGHDVDVNNLMRTVAGYEFASFCFGGDGSDLTDVVAAVDDGVRATLTLMNRSLRLPSWMPTPAIRRMRHSGAALRRLVHQRVTDRLAHDTPPQPRDLLDTVLQPGTTDTHHIEVSLNLMLRASYSIPGAALTWAVRQLALQPQLTQRLRDEANALHDPAAIDRPYAEAVVKEVLRMYPPSWFGGREVRHHTQLGEWKLQPGQQVMFSPYVVHRDPRWWDAPTQFRPQRWMTGQPPHARHAYFPFGAGPRICIGNQLGMLEQILTLSRLAQCYDIDVTNIDRAPMTARSILTPDGLRARFRRIALKTSSEKAIAADRDYGFHGVASIR
ncbi:MAG TPA: cytochrome P450 [Candidatus Stackebrandtia faecavium]|nr:cytochrome P450 [Candidatus Stackebrandtia faecavium]